MANEVFNKYYSRLAKEGWLKALICGIAVGCAVAALSAALMWFFAFRQGLWIAVALFAVATAVATIVFYRTKFRPTARSIARRVDKLGLEERLITMLELEKDTSYMAMKQRENTMEALKSVDSRNIKFALALSAPIVVALIVAGVFGLGMTTVSALYYAEAIPSGMDMLKEPDPAPEVYQISYSIGTKNGGSLYWYADLTGDDYATVIAETNLSLSTEVDENSDAPAVFAVPTDGYSFLCWSDGVQNPYRQDMDVNKDLTITALFELVDDYDFDDSTGQPSDNGNGNNSGSGDSDLDVPPSGDSSGGGTTDNSSGDTDGKSSQRDSANMQVDNGSTYIGDVLDNSQEQAMNNLSQNTEMSDDRKSMISDYYDSLNYGDESDSDGE